jgi:hypothetical protein
MSRLHKLSRREDASCQRKTRSADGLSHKGRSTESEMAKDWCAPDVCAEVMHPRSRISMLAPHIGNCSRAVLLSACEMQAPTFREARRSASDE